ncbi:EAL domain-containing protein [Acidithiobacillus ferrivorans]|uniref:bifunctional diguanylate cyclase/phosphodiesterase n=1 Tax=Acidithiobacillus ferrivorans TaxID=160808 RepID=UPI001E35AFA7|nr:EAL domain-containing protein [Acidithiobacillus ferrivorans]
MNLKVIPKIPAFLTRPITMPPYRWTIFLVFWGTLVGVLAFSGWYAWFSWHRYEQDSEYRLTLESDMVATVAQKLLDGHASGLRFLAVQLQRADALHHLRRARTLLLDYQKATSNIASANLIAPSGQVIASTTAPVGAPLPNFRNNPAIWPAFQKGIQTPGMGIYHPLRGPLVGHWVIPLRYTIFSSARKPLFVVTTPLRFRGISGFLSHLPLRTGTAVGLIRSDFYIEGRWPVPQNNLSKMLAHPVSAEGALRQALQRDPHARHGTYAGTVAVGDHTYRFGAFTRLSHYPLTAFVSVPRDQWLAAWWQRQIQYPLVFLLIAFGLSLTAYRRILFLDRRWELQRQTFERTLTTQATHDVLTGLPNRDGLRLVFDQALARTERQERLLAVGFLDLDAFKPVNDTYGHAAGDDLLKEIARRLQDAVRRTDTVARMGGDEFVLLLEGLRDMNELDQVLARLQAAIAQPFHIKGKIVSIQASLGLTLYPFDEGDADLLLRHADQAMYAAKVRTSPTKAGWVQLYHPDLGTLTVGDETLRQDFLRALASGAVTLRYQPLVAMATDRVAGLEALTRWHREGREVSPDRFLPSLGVRERQALGRFVLQTALQQLTQWRDMGLDLFLSVNVTPEELDQPGFADSVFAILATQPGIPPESLVLEVLEIGEILEQEAALEHLQRLRAAGIKIALDDVGSAYASLLRLKNLPIDEIKIDQGFIRELSNKPQDLIFVESLVNLGLAMGVLITVEGVETEAHIALLREMKINYLQGYAIARPLEAKAVADFVRSFVLGVGDADTPMLALYQHLGWVRAAAESVMNHQGHEHMELAACPITTWLHAHASELPEVETLLAEHETVHILGREILQVRQSGTREELHLLLGQLHVHSHRFQEGLGQAVKAMRDNAAATASERCDRDVGIQESGKKLQID